MAASLKGALAPEAPAAPVAAYPALKASIVLFDCNPGTRSWVVPDGVSSVRVFVVGGGGSSTTGASGGGYSEKVISVVPGQSYAYTVGIGAPSSAAPIGGTSSFAGVISATGGRSGPGGIGSGGDINTEGGLGAGASGTYAGGGAGHAFGAGGNAVANRGGGFSANGVSYLDGWKVGLLPGFEQPHGYGVGGTTAAVSPPLRFAGMGGGGAIGVPPGLGGGGVGLPGGVGLVGIEVLS